MKGKKEYNIRINIKKEAKAIKALRDKIKSEVIGQDRAVRRQLRAVTSYLSGLKDPRRPIGGFIFAGPTGVGKSFSAKVFARHFLGGKDKYRDYLTRIDGSTLSQEHEVARLTGAPPGYIGYNEPSLLLQENIDSYYFDAKVGKDDGRFARILKELEKAKIFTEGFFGENEHSGGSDIKKFKDSYLRNKPYRSVILFDEIEKAHPNIWNVLLQIMEEGELQLGKSGKKTNFSNSVIILTTNVGQRDIQEMLSYNHPKTDEERKDFDDRIYKVVKEKVKEKFPPELFKRLDLVVFRPLTEDDFVKILDNFLNEEQEKLDKKVILISRLAINISYTPKAKKFLLKEGVDINYGVRTLRAIVEKFIQVQIANGIASGEVRPGDNILVDEKDGELLFFRKSRPKGQNAIKHISLKEEIEGES